MTDASTQNDIKKMVSESLKRVDHLIKAGNIDQSIREIIQAKQLDPKNIYIYAYEERLDYLKKEHEKNIECEKTRREAEGAARRRDEELRKYEVGPHAEYDQKEHQGKMQETRNTDTVEISHSSERLNPSVLESFAKLLRDAWDKGAPSEEKREMLTFFCNKNFIPRERLNQLEQEIKYTAYSEAFKKAWLSGSIDPPQDAAIQELRNAFALSENEILHIEEQLLTELQNENKAPAILVIDDDEKLLTLISECLTSAGYEVISLTTSDEAHTLLQKKWIPNLILCDVNLETSTMSGFSLYEKIREIRHLDAVPFIFLTGLKDELLAWRGRELGADDYLTKPITEKNLRAAIKGKLKRFSTLKKKT